MWKIVTIFQEEGQLIMLFSYFQPLLCSGTLVLKCHWCAAGFCSLKKVENHWVYELQTLHLKVAYVKNVSVL